MVDAPGGESSSGGLGGIDGAAGLGGVAGEAGTAGSGGAGGTAGAGGQSTCNAAPTSGTPSLTLSGPIGGGGGAGGTSPTSAQVILLWTPKTGTGDEAYVWGKGTFLGSNYNLTLDTAPPADAMFGDIALGQLALVDKDYVYQPGPLDAAGVTEFQTHLIGWNFMAAIVWKSSSAATLGYWPDLYGDMYSCGTCCAFKDGNPSCCYEPNASVDAFAPMSCANMPIYLASSVVNVCKWY